ncbi:phosphoglycerate dehydrogenase, partial [Candidatus Roizmanbacteria bacterium]|nr:phosphoglycerate dehydrogenase [Candidatus Roizmanbacteria bacterium]
MKQHFYYIIDFDSTFVQCEMLEELAKIALRNNPQKKEILKEIVSICNLGMEGRIPFQESLRRRLQLIKLHKNHLQTLIQSLNKNITPSIVKNRQFFLENKKNIYIISGAFKECILSITNQFSIPENHILANTLTYDNNGNIAGVDTLNPLAYKYGKAKAVKNLGLKG